MCDEDTGTPYAEMLLYPGLLNKSVKYLSTVDKTEEGITAIALSKEKADIRFAELVSQYKYPVHATHYAC